MRLFVAVRPPIEVLAELESAVAPLRALPGAERLRWTLPEAWHLTLVFLGEVPQERLPELRDGLAQVALGYVVHQVRLAGGGRFGDRVLWVGLAGQTWALRSLARAVTQVASEVLAVEEEFSYHPHLTLARAGGRGHHSHPGREERAALHEAAERLETFEGAEYSVTSIQLMRSDFGSGHGPVHYTSVGSWDLAYPQ
ncbi:RNA 2',3'-cyclic phosphodiesterase [Kitasatospora azatica]|uniref:RNA 2',3'-cyclic phosphodiesterase n=1 Tax=Kitasatospora azatica TaxID=58347 RepID=UPI00055DEF76|nr:RNA 2',3'-cyclic phosphodiesterase [Kitasatospora azatica]